MNGRGEENRGFEFVVVEEEELDSSRKGTRVVPLSLWQRAKRKGVVKNWNQESFSFSV